MADTWKSIAVALGNAMQNHQYCDDHSLAEADIELCPFCADRAVFMRYKKFAEKHGVMFYDPLAGAKSVSIYDIPRTDS